MDRSQQLSVPAPTDKEIGKKRLRRQFSHLAGQPLGQNFEKGFRPEGRVFVALTEINAHYTHVGNDSLRRAADSPPYLLENVIQTGAAPHRSQAWLIHQVLFERGKVFLLHPKN